MGRFFIATKWTLHCGKHGNAESGFGSNRKSPLLCFNKRMNKEKDSWARIPLAVCNFCQLRSRGRRVLWLLRSGKVKESSGRSVSAG